VVLASRKQAVLDTARQTLSQQQADAMEKFGAKVWVCVCNIRDEESVERLMKYCLEVGGRLDFLVNNGGGQFPSPAANISKKGWHAVVETNLTGTFLCCREAYKAWMEEHGGAIVNIIADMWNGFPGMSHTGAARAGVENLTKSLSVEWASSGVRINAIAPGVIYSPTAAANYEGETFFASLSSIPAKRIGTTQEVSGMVCFLLSPAAAYITGGCVRIDGGASLRGSTFPIPEHNAFPPYGTPPPNKQTSAPIPAARRAKL
jgi:peroxisomal trans-2-enoyl-CoA reductase